QHVGRPRISRGRKAEKPEDAAQMQLFIDPAHELMRALGEAKMDELTPIQAFDLLRQWKEKYK
ncbi:MAG TPA: hypothetical protein VLI90_02625, partial [Tepidisphaeraceae bacterium]|nr:hypothetical protein [Tepidisphaeraceae bacterium]